MGLIGSVGSMEMIRGIVDVDGNARKMGLPLLVGTRRCQKCRGSESQYESTLSGRCDQDARAGEGKAARCPVRQGSECGKHDREYPGYQRKWREHQRQSCTSEQGLLLVGGGAVALEADGSMASPDWDTSSQVAECWALAVVVSDDAVDRDDDELNINPPTPFQ